MKERATEMNLEEWLMRVGFHGNPFALKQADEEGEQLNEYFVALPAYTALIDTAIQRSSILHAPRGSGKSSMRRMFELHCQRETAEPPALVVRLADWMPITARHSVASVVPAESHIGELARRLVLALAQSAHAPWSGRRLDADLEGQLAWLCLSYGDYLAHAERRTLAGYGWLPDTLDRPSYDLDRLPVARRVQILAALVSGLGFRGCHVLIDGVDELLETAADWEAGANLIEALLANLGIVEAPQIAFKFFIPSEVVHELRRRGRLRDDRIQTLAVEWSGPGLRELLSRRLQAFSDGVIGRLAQLSAPGFAEDTDAALVRAAGGSPRALLNLGDQLFQLAADRADDTYTFITPEDLDRALAALAEPPPARPEAAVASAPLFSPEGVPLLRIEPNGEIWMGDRLFDAWRQLTPLQRTFIDYLYKNRGRLCRYEEVIASVWPKERQPADDDSLRKLVDRMVALLEPEAKVSRYIEKVPGNLRLIHTR